MSWGARVIVTLLALATCACAAYDSRWLQQRQEQKKYEENLEPAQLRREGTPDRPAKPMRLRVHATPAFIAETTNWQARVAELVQDANGVLSPALEIRVVVAGYREWHRETRDDDLAPVLEELETLDPGDDVDWVVGLVGSVPKLATDFSTLGVARLGGKHFLLRAINNRAEFDAILKWTTLSESDRADLLRKRKRHKAAAVLLHEIGHTLSAIHVTEGSTLMRTHYQDKATGFAGYNVELMRLFLEYRARADKGDSKAPLRAVVKHLENTRAPWVGSDRQEQVDALRAVLDPRPAEPALAPTQAAAPLPPEAPPKPLPPPRDLTDAERALFDEAIALEKAGKVNQARAKAKALFEAHPSSAAIQDLRCRLASAMGLQWAAIKTECEAIRRLSGASGSPWWGGGR